MPETIEIEVTKIIPFEPLEGSKGLAAVLLKVGPLSLWCKIFTDANGVPFLSMPARKGKNERYYQSAFFSERAHHDKAQELVIEAFKLQSMSPN